MKHCLKVSVLIVFLATLSLVSWKAAAQKKLRLQVNEEWIKDSEPFRIAGNLYYVGTYELACYLITTPRGNILINTGTSESVPMIRAHLKRLGFPLKDIKILLTNQAHFDHVGGMAKMKKITGARLLVDDGDAQVLADGGYSDFDMGGKGLLFEPVQADQLLHDRDTIQLGGVQIMLLHHPGHTKGSCSFLFDVKDENHSYRILIANMPTVLSETNLAGMPAYPNVRKDYAYTLNELPKLQFDLWLCPHAGQFDLHRKRQPGDGYHPEVFMDRNGYDTTIASLQQAYAKKLSADLIKKE